MQDTKQGLSRSRSITALAMLLVVDSLSFVSVGQGTSGIEFGFVTSTESWIGLGVDLALAIGLLKASDWALELARYRCVIGLCYFAFIWSSYFIVMSTSVGVVGHTTVLYGVVRDGLLGFILLVALFVLREKKLPVVPNTNTDQTTLDNK